MRMQYLLAEESYEAETAVSLRLVMLTLCTVFLMTTSRSTSSLCCSLLDSAVANTLWRDLV